MNINDVVLLKIDLPEAQLTKGSCGTIVAIFDKPTKAFEVEFCNNEGATIAEVALTIDEIELHT